MTTIKRRDFLRNSTAAVVAGMSPAAVFAISENAHADKLGGQPLKLFSAHEARQLDAISERIIPRTDTPGARDLGVIHFIDRACGDEMATALAFIQHSLADIDQRIQSAHVDDVSFADLGAKEQDAFLTTIESTPFFGLMAALTRFGYYGMSKYGGNANHASWSLVGYRGHNGGWQYPFGHYDREVHGGEYDE